MSDAQNIAWWGDPGEPGSEKEAAWKRTNLKWFTLNCGVKLLLNKSTGHLIKGFWDELEQLTGYSLKDAGVPDDWGFSNRRNRNNPKVWSNHRYGNASDGNSEENPNTHDYKIHTNMPVEEVRRLAAKWGLKWGGDYLGKTKDPMHVEYIKSPMEISKYPIGGNTPVGIEEWMQDCYFMITPDGSGIIVFKGLQGKVCSSPNQFYLLTAMGWAKAYNPKNDQERMQPDIFDFLTQ